MALITRYNTFLEALIPHWSGPGDDRLKEVEQEIRLDIDEECVTFIHEGARPTNPYLLKIKIEDIKELAKLLEKDKLQEERIKWGEVNEP